MKKSCLFVICSSEMRNSPKGKQILKQRYGRKTIKKRLLINRSIVTKILKKESLPPLGLENC